jgi:hypothetical protein
MNTKRIASIEDYKERFGIDVQACLNAIAEVERNRVSESRTVNSDDLRELKEVSQQGN